MKTNNSFMHLVMADLRHDEGFRTHPYLCTAGYMTIGYGRNLDAVGISRPEADILLRSDIIRAQEALERVIPGAFGFGDHRYRALVEMTFNLGGKGLSSFRRMIRAIEDRDFNKAADEMLDSRWAAQVGSRAERLAGLMRGPC